MNENKNTEVETTEDESMYVRQDMMRRSETKEQEKLTKAQARRKIRKLKKENRQPMRTSTKVVLTLLGIAVCALCLYVGYYLIHYVSYNKYKTYLTGYEYETGTGYKPLADSKNNVKDYDLVAENDNLKLYAQVSTGNVAIYDKRNDTVTYSNPMDPDSDSVANPSNIEMLKSQLVVQYFNEDVNTGILNSYGDCVLMNQLKYESIGNGIRYIYTIGNPRGEGTASEQIHFRIPVEYRLNEDNVEVSIPTDHIEEYGKGYVYRIQLLRYMAATSYDTDGYMVVPNGSGSLINYNNGKSNAANYSQFIYDIDPLVANYTTLEETTAARLPLYAMCSEKTNVLVTAEEGDTLALITAGTSGIFNDYNYAYMTFVLRNSDNLRMFGNATQDVFVMEQDIYDVNCTVRYTFLDDEHTGYAGVANYYRDRLIEEGKLTAIEEAGDIPFYMDILAATRETGHFLGVQYLHTFAMTTFAEAADISNKLAADGITNQVMNLQGWFNKGYNHDAAHNINVIGKLGGRSGLSKLNKTLEANGGTLYADVALQNVTAADKGFSMNNEASRYYAGYVASFGLVNPTTLRNTSNLGYLENRYSVISPKFLPRYVDKFSKKSKGIAVDGIALRDLGSTLASDKKRTNPITREEALEVVLGQFDTLEGTGKKLMLSDANSYAFAYASDIINVPMEDNTFPIVDERVPLYEMIIHGYIPYSSDLLNFTNSDNMPNIILEMIETGSAPHFVFTKEESSQMKMTALNRFYTTTFDNWEESAVDTYNQVNEALSLVSNAAIVDHVIEGDVRKVTYDNGVVIYINYGNFDATMDGITIPSKSYEVEGK